jgi:hypothetical protein
VRVAGFTPDCSRRERTGKLNLAQCRQLLGWSIEEKMNSGRRKQNERKKSKELPLITCSCAIQIENQSTTCQIKNKIFN